MRKLSMSSLLVKIYDKFIFPAIKHRKYLLLTYVKNMDEEHSNYIAFNLLQTNGENCFLHSSDDVYATTLTKNLYLFNLPDHNQVEINKNLQLIKNLEESVQIIKTYLSYLNNKSNNVCDIAYALPTHINQLVPMITPTTYCDDDLRDPEVYALLNELQIKLLLLS